MREKESIGAQSPKIGTLLIKKGSTLGVFSSENGEARWGERTKKQPLTQLHDTIGLQAEVCCGSPREKNQRPYCQKKKKKKRKKRKKTNSTASPGVCFS